MTPLAQALFRAIQAYARPTPSPSAPVSSTLTQQQESTEANPQGPGNVLEPTGPAVSPTPVDLGYTTANPYGTGSAAEPGMPPLPIMPPTAPFPLPLPDVNAGAMTDANVGVPQPGNAGTAAQTAPESSSGVGGNTAPGSGAAGQGQGSFLVGLQRNSTQDFSKSAGGLFDPSLPTTLNSAPGYSKVNYSVLTPQQRAMGYKLQNGNAVRGLFSV